MQKILILLFMLLAGMASGQQLPEHDPGRDDTFITVEQMPSFPGGQDSLFAFIRKNLVYPDKAIQQGMEGKVMVGFVIDQSGRVRNAEIRRGIHPLLDMEALRVVRKMPVWQPGIQDGKAVNVSYVLPFNFKLDL